MFRLTNLHFFLVAQCLIFSHNQPFRLWGGMHRGVGRGDARASCASPQGTPLDPGSEEITPHRQQCIHTRPLSIFLASFRIRIRVHESKVRIRILLSSINKRNSTIKRDSFCFVIFFVRVLKVNVVSIIADPELDAFFDPWIREPE